MDEAVFYPGVIDYWDRPVAGLGSFVTIDAEGNKRWSAKASRRDSYEPGGPSDLQRCDEDGILACHTWGETSAHEVDEDLQVVACNSGVVRDGDLLRQTSVTAL